MSAGRFAGSDHGGHFALNIGDAIHVRDIQLPQGVTPKVQVDLTAFSVVAPVVEEEPVAAEAEAAAADRK